MNVGEYFDNFCARACEEHTALVGPGVTIIPRSEDKEFTELHEIDDAWFVGSAAYCAGHFVFATADAKAVLWELHEGLYNAMLTDAKGVKDDADLDAFLEEYNMEEEEDRNAVRLCEEFHKNAREALAKLTVEVTDEGLYHIEKSIRTGVGSAVIPLEDLRHYYPQSPVVQEHVQRLAEKVWAPGICTEEREAEYNRGLQYLTLLDYAIANGLYFNRKKTRKDGAKIAVHMNDTSAGSWLEPCGEKDPFATPDVNRAAVKMEEDRSPV